jgi:hypothetical protein
VTPDAEILARLAAWRRLWQELLRRLIVEDDDQNDQKAA